MGQRLRPAEVALLAEESPATPKHNATVEIFEPGESGFDYERLLELIADRIAFVPRYRQRLQTVPGGLANPSWVDDPAFDLRYHVRRSALPRPGSLEQLRELVSRIVSRPLDRSKPLWEMYVVEGLSGGRVALLSKAHQVLVDGVETVDLGQVLLDNSPSPKSLGADDWRPKRPASPGGVVLEAIGDSLKDPDVLADTVRTVSGTVLRNAADARRSARRTVAGLTGRRTEPRGQIAARHSQQRRVVSVLTELDAYKRIRDVHGGTVNDVILATITGGLRGWLLTHDESLRGFQQVRAVVPVSVIDRELQATSLGSQIAPHFVELPVGEPSPVVRLHQVSYSFQAHKETGRGVAANRLAGIAGFAPTTFHAIGARVAAEQGRRAFQLMVTNVPGPQSPLYAAGAEMVATYPVPPLLPGHALAVGVTSYNGTVAYGITADGARVPDADVLGQCLTEALDELLDTISEARPRAPRGRRRPKAVRSGAATEARS
ncbi:wax ester/triacylglycerol synthase family O-acyltransferase [Nocardioides fonticola]|uniref:Diacylglycerol O-acyltransferase n=1 Tax=Nocardioides fonticola TaxID=450363 RepID=A0ABP7Y433_9ACTN